MRYKKVIVLVLLLGNVLLFAMEDNTNQLDPKRIFFDFEANDITEKKQRYKYFGYSDNSNSIVIISRENLVGDNEHTIYEGEFRPILKRTKNEKGFIIEATVKYKCGNIHVIKCYTYRPWTKIVGYNKSNKPLGAYDRSSSVSHKHKWYKKDNTKKSVIMPRIMVFPSNIYPINAFKELDALPCKKRSVELAIKAATKVVSIETIDKD